MLQDNDLPTYQSFLLRCWLISPAQDDEPARRRYSLRDVAADPTEVIFGSAAELAAYLAGESLNGDESAEG